MPFRCLLHHLHVIRWLSAAGVGRRVLCRRPLHLAIHFILLVSISLHLINYPVLSLPVFTTAWQLQGQHAFDTVNLASMRSWSTVLSVIYRT
jgi:hypothetical protein